LTLYIDAMIASFRHKGLKRLHENDDRKALSPELVDRIRVVLADLDGARRITDLGRPSFRLHALKGDRKGFWSITIRANWRIIFRFEDGKALDVDFLDYH
jgi:proteic killer suppression protein